MPPVPPVVTPESPNRWDALLAAATEGMSARAIRDHGRPLPHAEDSHPYDTGDLLRCIAYCDRNGLTPDDLRARMAEVSPEWRHLTDHWELLVATLREELGAGGGKAPRTYALMKRHLHAARAERNQK